MTQDSTLYGDMKISGDISEIYGNASGLYGDVSELRGDVTHIYGEIKGLYGNVSLLSGKISGLKGDATGVEGDATGIELNLDLCPIENKQRLEGIHINKLILNKKPSFESFRKLAEEIADHVLFLNRDGEYTEESYVNVIEDTLRNSGLQFPD